MYNFIKQIKEDCSVTKNDIENIEIKYNIKFPEILKNYYLKHNGDTIKLCSFIVDDYEYEISKIVPLKYGSSNFEHIIDGDREDSIITENMLPIARNRGGDYYYWDVNDEKVYLYYCDDIENPVYICNNIKSLFDIMINSNQR